MWQKLDDVHDPQSLLGSSFSVIDVNVRAMLTSTHVFGKHLSQQGGLNCIEQQFKLRLIQSVLMAWARGHACHPFAGALPTDWRTWWRHGADVIHRW